MTHFLAIPKVNPSRWFSGPTPVDANLLAFLRIMCLKSLDEVNEWSEGEEAFKGLLEPAESFKKPELDQKAFQYLSTRCTLLLRSYPTTLEADAEVREDQEKFQKLSMPRRLALILRMGEKKILNVTIKFCQDRLASK